MKNTSFVILLLLAINVVWGQQNIIDSLKNIINRQRKDTTEVHAFIRLSDIYNYRNIDSAIAYIQQGLLLARQLNYAKGEANCYIWLGASESNTGNYSQSILHIYDALRIYEKLHDKDGIIVTHLALQSMYRKASDYKNALVHAFEVKRLAEPTDAKGTIVFTNLPLMPLIFAEIAATYLEMNKLDTALFYARKAMKQNLLFHGAEWNFPYQLLGNIEAKQKKYNRALEIYRSAILLAIQNGFPKDTLDIYNSISRLYKDMHKLDSAVYYAKEITNKKNSFSWGKILLEATTTLAQTYKLKGDKDSALKYIEISNALKDSIYSQDEQRKLQGLTFNEQMRQQEIESEQAQYKSKVKMYALIGVLVVLLLIAGILWRNNRYRQRAYALLQKQKRETEQQKAKTEQTLEELKTAQAQLIQSEKMASLGELTAGIAHEIQNPLNFVNNFSDVNKELIEELKSEKSKIKSERDEQLEEELLNNIAQNLDKINHHGKRADAIVKGMLQHTRTSTGQKEPTGINALCDEYLRLSYHGLRAKDKDFNANFTTDFDESIGKIEVVPQDIGRVLLNLYNNAFYSVNEKKKALNGTFEPMVEVSTKRTGDKIEISVRDNGTGIPKKVLDKIFQPFFTTKPTGQGTGLGLSLSYDIIKAHGGKIKVETKEGEGVEFIIQLQSM